MRYILIDKINKIEKDKMAVGIKCVTLSEDFFEEHFPGFSIMPGALIIEAMVQLGSWLISFSTDFNYKGIIKTLKQARFIKMARPGDQILIEVIIESKENEFVYLKGKARVNNEPVAVASFSLKLIETIELEDLATTKQLFDNLYYARDKSH